MMNANKPVIIFLMAGAITADIGAMSTRSADHSRLAGGAFPSNQEVDDYVKGVI